jgi:hypothetical protein
MEGSGRASSVEGAPATFERASRRSEPVLRSWETVCLVALCCHATMLGLSWVVGALSGAEAWWLWLTYVLGSLGGWYVHRLGHARPGSTRGGLAGSWSSLRLDWFKAHTIGHHANTYPLRSFTKPEVLASPEPNEPYYYPLFFGFVALTLVMRGLVAGLLVAVIAYEVAVWTSWLHEQYHLEGSVLESYAWFRTMREVHRLHHDLTLDVHYGIVDLSWDWALGTLARGQQWSTESPY